MNGGIGDWIERRADRKPGAVALIDGDNGRRLSYGALREAVAELAGGLYELGVRRGDRIAVLMENSPEMVEVIFAAANLGAIVVPINVRLAAAEIGYVLGDSGAMVFVVSGTSASVALNIPTTRASPACRSTASRRRSPRASTRSASSPATAWP